MSTKVAEKVAGAAARKREPKPARPHDEADDAFAQVFAALGEPTRLRIMQILPREPVCEQMYNVIELAEELGLTQPTVSHHLKILSEAGLVQCRRQCNSLYFYVNQPVVLEWLGQTKCRFGCEGRSK
jgi:ArsR family transcriptional regulator, arsenate/arsenite/antimonite-responsive transcriptional repressor